jgi:hypothetical protein
MAFSTPRNSQYSSPDRHTYRPEVGWVSVEIGQQHRGGLWQRIKARAGGLLWRRGLWRPTGNTPGPRPAGAAGRA